MEKKQSLKKFFILLGTWFVTIMAVFLGSALYDRYKTSEYDGRAMPYIRDVLPEISKWDPATTMALMPTEVVASIPEERFIKAMSWFSRLGELKSVDDPQFADIHTGKQTDVGEQTIVEYNVEAEYANGDATINLKLLVRDDSFEIYNFNVSSETLLE